MKLPRPTIHATLLRRYKRFLADVRLESGEEITVHCPNPGGMTGCDAPGSAVVLSVSDSPSRKLRHTWELVRVGRYWVGINTLRTNAVVREGIEAGRIPELAGYSSLRAEVRFGQASRVDFLLEGDAGRCYVEVKNATLADRSVALFPDAVTARGLKHLEELSREVREGHRAVMLFLVNRGDCRSFRPAAEVDPAYARGLNRAVQAGVEVLVHSARVRPTSIELHRRLPADLSAHLSAGGSPGAPE